MSKNEVDQQLLSRFGEFLSFCTKDMQDVYDKRAKENNGLLAEEQRRVDEILNAKAKQIQNLLENIKSMRNLKNSRTERLYLAFSRTEAKRKLRRVLNAWIRFHENKVHKKKMNNYIMSFYKRGILARNFKGWRLETRKLHKDSVNQAMSKKIYNEVATASQNAIEESELLRTMVKELTEDLRNETVAKNSLKYRFEQALLRGMSALNIETMGIHQDIISQTRSFTDTSRALLYTPEKFGYFTRS